jgi:HD-GYP domain-containing protein (c-di-GMP phosphodiesterase class II)
MRKCGTKQLKTGMKLARPIYDQNYRKLLAEGTELDGRSLSRIQSMGFRYIYVQEDGTEDIKVEELIGVKCRREAHEALRTVVEFDKRKNQKSTNPFAQRQKKASGFGKDHLQLVQLAVRSMHTELLYARHPVYYPGVYLAKDQLINHSTDVAVLSLLIGVGFGFNSKELDILGQAALFHDVGKMRLDPELLTIHPLDMNEEQKDLYSMHPQMGAVLLEQDISTDIHVTMSISQHHERQDGTGFPEGMMGGGEPPKSQIRKRGTIHRFAEIISLSNYFDNLVSGRVERDPVSPFDAVQMILDKTPSWFNPHIVQRAVSMISVFPEGCNVQIADTDHYKYVGYRGVVSKINVENLQRPTVTLLYNNLHKRLDPPIEVDFTDDKRISFEFLLDL